MSVPDAGTAAARSIAAERGERRDVDYSELELDLERAVERGELVLHYQPIVELGTNVIRGVEALVRWDHPQRGLLAPGAFLPIAETTGTIVPLGRWVLDDASRRVREWQRQHTAHRRLTLNVNISARQLLRSKIVSEVSDAVERSGLSPELLTLELSANAFEGDSSVVAETLARLKNVGVRLALEDLATGTLSLARALALPLDVIKLERSFVDGLDARRDDLELALAVVQVARAWKLDLIAVGIERPRQVEILRQLGVDRGQGYYLARPTAAGSWSG